MRRTTKPKPRNPYARELIENRLFSLKVKESKKPHSRKIKHKGQQYDNEDF
jgi:hypothetical protein